MERLSIDVVENATNVCNIKTETPLEKVVSDCMTDYLKMRKAEKCKCKTNADKIRSMSDEELAKERIDRIDIYTKSDLEEFIGDFDGIVNSEEEAIKKELEWLQSEA